MKAVEVRCNLNTANLDGSSCSCTAFLSREMAAQYKRQGSMCLLTFMELNDLAVLNRPCVISGDRFQDMVRGE